MILMICIDVDPLKSCHYSAWFKGISWASYDTSLLFFPQWRPGVHLVSAEKLMSQGLQRWKMPMRPQSLRHSRDDVCARLWPSEIREKKHDEKTWENPDCRKKNTHGNIRRSAKRIKCTCVSWIIIVDTEFATEKQASFSHLFTTLSFQLTDVGRMTPAMQKCCRRAQHRNNNNFPWRILAKQATAGAGEWSKHVEIEISRDVRHGEIMVSSTLEIHGETTVPRCQKWEVPNRWGGSCLSQGTVILETWHKDIVLYYINLYIYKM